MLRLLGGDLGGPDIARQLSVSLNTVRTHTKNIYAKLGVTSRRDAVRQARELNLIPGGPRPLSGAVDHARITTCGDDRSPHRRPPCCVMSEQPNRPETGESPIPSGTRSASPATSPPAGPPASTA